MPPTDVMPGAAPPGTVSFGTMPPDMNTSAGGPGPAGPEPLWQPAPGAPNGPPQRLPPVAGAPPDQSFADEPYFRRVWDMEFPRVCADYRNYYSWDNAILMAGGFGVGAVVANTRLDTEFTSWYQSHVANSGANKFATSIRPLGEGQYTIPLVVTLALLNDTGWWDDNPVLHTVGDWGDRVTRAYLVGGVPMLAMQEITGGDRPSSTDPHSSWKPFSASNGVSGDAFMSSCMFISAADMSDGPLAKGFFYACSLVVPWERIELNQHYLSQVGLGYYMGYLACRAVNNTELAHRQLTLVPVVTPEMSGIGVMYQH
jgi:hypothetical protein